MLKKCILSTLGLSILIILFNSNINLSKATTTIEQDKFSNTKDIIYKSNPELPSDKNMDINSNIEIEEYDGSSFIPKQLPTPYTNNELEYVFL